LVARQINGFAHLGFSVTPGRRKWPASSLNLASPEVSLITSASLLADGGYVA
jgi:hypothetical protein